MSDGSLVQFSRSHAVQQNREMQKLRKERERKIEKEKKAGTENGNQSIGFIPQLELTESWRQNGNQKKGQGKRYRAEEYRGKEKEREGKKWMEGNPFESEKNVQEIIDALDAGKITVEEVLERFPDLIESAKTSPRVHTPKIKRAQSARCTKHVAASTSNGRTSMTIPEPFSFLSRDSNVTPSIEKRKFEKYLGVAPLLVVYH